MAAIPGALKVCLSLLIFGPLNTRLCHVMSLKVLLDDFMSFSTCHFIIYSALALDSNNLGKICNSFHFEASTLRVIDLGVVPP